MIDNLRRRIRYCGTRLSANRTIINTLKYLQQQQQQKKFDFSLFFDRKFFLGKKKLNATIYFIF